MYCILCPQSTASTEYFFHCIHWFDLFAQKTMSPPPYTTIPLCTAYCVHRVLLPLSTASTASTGLTFLHQRQCPHHHISLFHCVYCIHCVHCIHWFDLFAPKTMSPPPYTTIPLCTVYCVHCIHWFDLFAPKTMSLPPCSTIPLCTVSTAYCIHCILCLLCTVSTAYCIHCMPWLAYVGNLFALTKYPCHPPTLLITHETNMNQKLVISNQYLMSPPPTKKVPKSYTFLPAWPI